MNNPLCQGTNCTKSNSAIRLVPLDDSSTVKMCASCYVTEMEYNDTLSTRILPKIPFSIFPLYVHSQDECNRVLAEADPVPPQEIARGRPHLGRLDGIDEDGCGIEFKTAGRML